MDFQVGSSVECVPDNWGFYYYFYRRISMLTPRNSWVVDGRLYSPITSKYTVTILNYQGVGVSAPTTMQMCVYCVIFFIRPTPQYECICVIPMSCVLDPLSFGVEIITSGVSLWELEEGEGLEPSSPFAIVKIRRVGAVSFRGSRGVSS